MKKRNGVPFSLSPDYDKQLGKGVVMKEISDAIL